MQSHIDASNKPQVELDTEKSLVLKKLALEIAELERPWWKRPVYILAALPTLLAIAALSVGFLNGFFSAQLTKLDNQKHDLEAEIKEFERTRNDLRVQIEEARAELAVKEVSLNRIKPIVSKLRLTAWDMRRHMSSEPEKLNDTYYRLDHAILELAIEIQNDEKATQKRTLPVGLKTHLSPLLF